MAPRHTRVVRPDDAYWAELDNELVPQPLDPLGLSDPNVKGHSNRYAVQRGKMVPQHHCVDVVLLPSQNDSGSIHSKIAPPRRSSRRLQQRQRRASHSPCRPFSSVYSHSDGELSSPTPEYMLASASSLGGFAALQISPPSSPDINGAAHRPDAGEVSPIDDDFDHAQRSAFANRTHLDARNIPSYQRNVSSPNPTRAGSHDQDAVLPSLRRQASLAPPLDEGAWSQHVVYTKQAVHHPDNRQSSRDGSGAQQLYGCQTIISSAANLRPKSSSSSSFGQRMRLMGKTKPAATGRDSPSNGVNSRSVTVQHVRDDLTVAPLNIPSRVNQKRLAGHGEKLGVSPPGAETPIISTGGSAMRWLLQASSKNKPKQPPAQAAPRRVADKQCPIPQSAYPSPPHVEITAQEVAGRPPHLLSARDLQSQALRSHPPAFLPPSLNVIKRKPPLASPNASPPSHHKYSDNDIPGRNVESARTAATAATAAAERGGGAGGGGRGKGRGNGGLATTRIPSDSCSEVAPPTTPPSRFSITTYATSDAGTPPMSSKEVLPPLPLLSPVRDVMDHSRPVDGEGSSSSSSQQRSFIEIPGLFMSAGEQQQRQQEQQQHAPADRRIHRPQMRSVSDAGTADTDRSWSSLSMSKPLPLAPHEGKSGDLVSQLDAQISALFYRRVNVEKSIKQITEQMPRDNLLASEHVLRKREEEKQKVDNLREELAEIQRQEHELGLKLYRARKRQEKEADFESTPLWVSRVAA
ncbi:hypothetical protein E4U43_007906 [Claviceps pusilla]|uniref:Uncharacterized protein n=1 Tax=Claviceps pusilla TaxID=123648 RepID=A0A9P7NCS1_9HYPO|nr:hypothetical protein E4U43_007906 [Claviceps pusilla]